MAPPSSDSFEDSAEFTLGSSTGHGDLQEQAMDIEKTTKRTQIAALLVVIVGALASSSFLFVGITGAQDDVADSFDRRASDVAKEVDGSWSDYESSTLWIHESCRNWREDNFTHDDFEVLYSYLISGGMEFGGMQWVPNVTHAERAAIEIEANVSWSVFPRANYSGFMGQEPDPENPDELVYTDRSEQPFYFPILFGEDRASAASVANYDLWSTPWEKPTIEEALLTWKPSLTGPFTLRTHTAEDGYSVVLYNPGTPLPDKYGAAPRDLSNMVINTKDLLLRSVKGQSESLSVYLFDMTENFIDENDAPQFLAGLEIVVPHGNPEAKELTSFPETEYAALQTADHYFEQDLKIGQRTWMIVVIPVEGTYEANLTFIILSGCLVFAASVLLAIWMIHNMRQSIAMHRVLTKAAAEAAIVTNLFPANVRERMIKDAETQRKPGSKKGIFDSQISSEGIFGTKPIADLHPYTTVMIADLCGFTPWASVRDPGQVFSLLETIFHGWDQIANRRRVYKVETVGDKYVAVAGLPEARSDHAVVMSRFASDCARKFQNLIRALEKTLGPDTGELGCRFGLHSGQVIGGVLRGDKGRFQLFGDCVNMASSMESTGVRNKIQISSATADLLAEAGHGDWTYPREMKIDVKGKGAIQTYFLKNLRDLAMKDGSNTQQMQEQHPVSKDDDKEARLIEWNVEVLSSLLKCIIARKQSMTKQRQRSAVPQTPPTGEMVLDEVAEVITLPQFDEGEAQNEVDPETIELDPEVVRQLATLVTWIASMYRNNPFHNFEHCSHVTMSVTKMMGRIQKETDAEAKRITSDPLNTFACAFSALIHDLDHTGAPNSTLIQEKSPLAKRYQGKSVAEQNSVDLAWAHFVNSDFDKLRACIYTSDAEMQRFRQLVVNSVMATDIMDKELGAARKARWSKAFDSTSEDQAGAGEMEDEQVVINRKATIVIEHLIQASDISHTMQHWNIYIKWNEALFHEMYKLYKQGRLEKDPSIGWYKGEMGFFDFYIIPLAKKLFTCGVFGVSSDEFLNYARLNRKEWEEKGEAIVEQYLKNVAGKFDSIEQDGGLVNQADC